MKRKPDKRIIISKTIVIIEYADGRDLVVKKDTKRAKDILSCVSLR